MADITYGIVSLHVEPIANGWLVTSTGHFSQGERYFLPDIDSVLRKINELFGRGDEIVGRLVKNRVSEHHG